MRGTSHHIIRIKHLFLDDQELPINVCKKRRARGVACSCRGSEGFALKKVFDRCRWLSSVFLLLKTSPPHCCCCCCCSNRAKFMITSVDLSRIALRQLRLTNGEGAAPWGTAICQEMAQLWIYAF